MIIICEWREYICTYIKLFFFSNRWIWDMDEYNGNYICAYYDEIEIYAGEISVIVWIILDSIINVIIFLG